MTTIHRAVEGNGGVVIKNPRDLFDAGACAECLVPLGRRTSTPMRVVHTDGQSRRYDGLLAQRDEWPLVVGPTYRLFSDRFLDWLSPGERDAIEWRQVEIVNPTKTTRAIFEPLPGRVHAEVATLRGGNTGAEVCGTCARTRDAHYTLAGSLPNWLNPDGSTRHGGQPEQYLVAQSLPGPPPPAFTFGDPAFGVRLALTTPPTPRRSYQQLAAIAAWPVGVVDAHLAKR